jgi:hypothetical protein
MSPDRKSKRSQTNGTARSAGSQLAVASTSDLGLADLSVLMVEIDLDELVIELRGDADDRAPEVVEPPKADAPGSSADRRRARRVSSSEVGDHVQVTVPRATRTKLLNVSDSGVLIETNCPLSPGRTTDAFVNVGGHHQALRVTVERSYVHALVREAVVYRSALHFERIIGSRALGLSACGVCLRVHRLVGKPVGLTVEFSPYVLEAHLAHASY